MAVKPLSGDQFFDSLAQAVTYKTDSDPLKVGREQDPIRRGFLELFSTPETRSDPETSVAQALTLMNGRFINQAASPKSGAMLQALLEDSALSDGERIERLYLATVSRFPTETERQTLQAVLTKEGEAERPQRLGDVLWMLLNSPEFRWNH
jgi:hypothetical protein